MAGALVLQVLTSLLRALGIEPAGQMVIYGVILLLIITFYGRQRSLRQ